MKFTDQAPFTEKPLKASKSLSGPRRELFYSRQFHQTNIPLLVSAQVLRARNLGQIDIAIINNKKEIEVIEVKSSEQGRFLSGYQQLRLKNALLFLTLIFHLPGRLQVIK